MQTRQPPEDAASKRVQAGRAENKEDLEDEKVLPVRPIRATTPLSSILER